MEISEINSQNIEEIRDLYAAFTNVAIEDFLFERPPINFNDFKTNFSSGYIKGYMCKTDGPEAFMLYTDSLNQAVEINIIYVRNNDESYKIKTAILEKFLADAKIKYSGKIISYPMLGTQNDFTPDITNLGFKIIGEMILEFNFFNTISQVVLAKASIPSLPSPYNIDFWQDIYFDDAAQTIQEEFSKSNDAKFDPRFNSFEGTKNILQCITQNYYGKFLPKITTVLKYEHKPIGYCFVNLTTAEIANIPLIVLDRKHQKQSFGAFMLRNSVNLLKNSITADKLNTKIINVTCDTDNFSAVKSYRKIGFKEKTYYTHAYKAI